MQKLNIVKAYECEQSLSLEKDHLKKLADGKFKVREILVFLSDDEKQALKEANTNHFDFLYYDKLLSEGKSDKATSYFIEHSKSIFMDSHIDYVHSLDELPRYAEENFLDGYKLENDVIYYN